MKKKNITDIHWTSVEEYVEVCGTYKEEGFLLTSSTHQDINSIGRNSMLTDNILICMPYCEAVKSLSYTTSISALPDYVLFDDQIERKSSRSSEQKTLMYQSKLSNLGVNHVVLASSKKYTDTFIASGYKTQGVLYLIDDALNKGYITEEDSTSFYLEMKRNNRYLPPKN